MDGHVAAQFRVVRDIADQVGQDVRGRRPAGTGVDVGRVEARGKVHGAARVLVRVFRRKAERQLIARMIDGADLRSPTPDQAHLVVGVHILGEEDVTRYRRESFAVGRQHAPILAGEELPRAILQVDKENAHPQHVGIARHIDVGRRVPEEIGLEITQDFGVADLGIEPQAEARVLQAEAGFGQGPVGGVGVRDRSETGTDVAPVERTPVNRSEIHEAERREIGPANPEEERRAARGSRCHRAGRHRARHCGSRFGGGSRRRIGGGLSLDLGFQVNGVLLGDHALSDQEVEKRLGRVRRLGEGGTGKGKKPTRQSSVEKSFRMHKSIG